MAGANPPGLAAPPLDTAEAAVTGVTAVTLSPDRWPGVQVNNDRKT